MLLTVAIGDLEEREELALARLAQRLQLAPVAATRILHLERSATGRAAARRRRGA